MKLDDIYFSDHRWSQRVTDWIDRENHTGGDNSFLDGNVGIVRQIMTEAESGLRMVVNISAGALLSFLDQGRYRNLYEKPVIGGVAREVSKERREVDDYLGFGTHAANYYFGAVALGGTGVRFYGEYCMALKRQQVAPTTRLFDRDSYDLLIPPLANEPDVKALARQLRGTWDPDVIDMLTLKLLPELRDAKRLITTGTVSELALRDQEFVEVHYDQSIVPDSIEEVRQSPDEVAMEARILSRSLAGFPMTAIELRWRDQRERVARALEAKGIHYRIVTLHGRGYQWR